MAPKKLLVLRILIEYPQGLFGSEMVHHSGGKLTRGTIYTLLERMIEEGFVREVEVPASATHHLARTKHFITAKGKTAFAEFLQELSLKTAPFRQIVSV